MFLRTLNLPKNQSYFLFGARGCGKTTLLKARLPDESTHYIDLLLANEEDRYRRNPDSLIALVDALPESCSRLVIDEIQKIPKLLDVVHHLIERKSRSLQFVLTGSSARNLRHGSANLLAGRAFTRFLFSVTTQELGQRFDLHQVLCWGSLPRVFSLNADEDKMEYLQAYAHTYLKEEIQVEQLVRRVEPFHSFLEVAAQGNGKLINYANIARDVGVDGKTVKTYYEILNDTLLGFYLEPYHTSRRKRLGLTPKFYFFDLGVCRALSRQLRMEPQSGTSYYGDLFVHWVVLELYRQEQYLNRDYRLSFMRTLDGAEVDLVVERPGKPLVLIEIKSTAEIREESTRCIRRFSMDFPEAKCMIWSRDDRRLNFNGILAVHWQEGLKQLSD